MKSPPWQYEWKRPRVTMMAKEQQDAQQQLKFDDVSAALVSPLEVAQLLPQDGSTITDPLLMTVMHSGNRIRIALHQSSAELLKRRDLQWPAMFQQDEQVRSIELCRRSTAMSKKKTKADALEVLNLMSLGGSRSTLDDEEEEEENTAINTDASSRQASSSADRDDDDDSGRSSELILVCLTSNGHVHLYNALELLLQEKAQEEEENDSDSDDGFGVGFASLLLGQNLFQQVQQSLYPLSKPTATIRLSVPLLQWERQVQQEQQKQSGFQLPFFNNQNDKEGTIDVGLFDDSFWDANVEPSTAMYRTLYNVPQQAVRVGDTIVAIFGKGSRIRRKRVVVHDEPGTDLVIVEGMEALQDTEEEDVEDWWQKQDSNEKKEDPDQKPDDNKEGNNSTHQEPWWKRGAHSEGGIVEEEEVGGFITFVDLHHYSETRTVYLPFAPKALYPVYWGNLSFVIVLAANDESSASPRVMAIRVDSGRKVYFDCGSSPTAPAKQEMEIVNSEGKIVKKPKCTVKRFNLIPILLPIDECDHVESTAVSSFTSSPPSIELLYRTTASLQGDNQQHLVLTLNALAHFDSVLDENEISLHYPHFHTTTGRPTTVIRTSQKAGHAARIPYAGAAAVTSRVFQGCSMIRILKRSYVVCWEGATEEHGAYVKELERDDDGEAEDSLLSTTVLGLNVVASWKQQKVLEDEVYIGKDSEAAEPPERNLQLPFTKPYELPSPGHQDVLDETLDDTKDILVDALDSISSLSYRGAESLLSPRSLSKVKRSQRLSHVEKSERLVRDCDSWINLEDSAENRALFEPQVPVLLSVGSGGSAEILSFRHRFVENGSATPFHQILSWLSQAEDYFTAASIALGLLQDLESWRNLKRLRDIPTDDLQGYDCDLEGLLDGIVALYPKNSLSLSPKPSAITQVADMTVGCLAKGGLRMSPTLDVFLRSNQEYDPARAGLMLVAVGTRCVSREKDLVNLAMGKGYEYSLENSDPRDLLWALRALLNVGVARDHLAHAIVLVNAALPDELRCRAAAKSLGNPPSIELSKTMVSTIISSSPAAAAILLGLVDEESRNRYWESLSHEAKLEFSLIKVENNSPLLQEPEVRNWAVQSLDECVRKEALPSSVGVLDLMPTEWLHGLCESCLASASCEYGPLLTYGVVDSDADADEGTTKYVREFQSALKAVTSHPGNGGLDFGLMIPALLILKQRLALWNKEAVVSTQMLLDAVCYSAGRTHEPRTFPFDPSMAMQQCGAASNVSAGANLVGGKNGLVLQCCDILIEGAGFDMTTAEAFVLSDTISLDKLPRSPDKQEGTFSLSDEHRKVLWLFVEHILSIRTFGEFHPTHLRGKVDPVFAAQACLRTWLALPTSSPGSTAWLVDWLRRKLGMTVGRISQKRLSCAALTRALMWPTSADESGEVLLGSILDVESTFLVQLAQSCHGLIESIPVRTAEDIIAQIDLPVVRVVPEFPPLRI